MEMQAIGQTALGRRGFISLGGRLFAAGAAAAYIPSAVWARTAIEKYIRSQAG